MKFSGYCFYINKNIQGDFQICISVPLILLPTEYNSTFSISFNQWTYECIMGHLLSPTFSDAMKLDNDIYGTTHTKLLRENFDMFN